MGNMFVNASQFQFLLFIEYIHTGFSDLSQQLSSIYFSIDHLLKFRELGSFGAPGPARETH